jgi:hypothetical protein
MKLNDKEIHAVLINSVRHCLTQHSYAPSECADLIRSRWAEIPENTKRIIIRDIDEAIRDDSRKTYRWPDDIYHNWTSLRELGSEYLPQLRSLAEASGDVGAPAYLVVSDNE